MHHLLTVVPVYICLVRASSGHLEHFARWAVPVLSFFCGLEPFASSFSFASLLSFTRRSGLDRIVKRHVC